MKQKQKTMATNQEEASIFNDKFKNVFVKNLSESLTNEDLRNYFGEYGTITSVLVMRDAEGKSKCFGFVNFENAEDAANCVHNLNGRKIDGKEWYVDKARNKSESRGRCGTNLFMKNLDDSIDDEKLREMFSGYGTITSCKVMRDSLGHSKGFGFVAFASTDEASRALAEMKGKMVLGKPLYVSLAQRKEQRSAWLQAQFSGLRNAVGVAPPVPGQVVPADSLNVKKINGKEWYVEKARNMSESRGPCGTNLYLKNLDDSIDDEKLREMFFRYGTITSCKVMRDSHGHSKGFGFVAFASPDEASRALTQMKGIMVFNKPLYVALAQPKDERRACLQAHFSRLGSAPPVFERRAWLQGHG